MNTVEEQISAFEAKRAAHVASMQKLMDDAAQAGSTLDAEQGAEYERLSGEVKAIDVHISRQQTQLAINKAAARPITPEDGASVEKASAARGGEPIRVTPNTPKGWDFARYCGSLVLFNGNSMAAEKFARAKWKDSPRVATALSGFHYKAAMTAGTTTDSDWAEPLVEYRTMAEEFIDLLRPATIIGRIQNPSLRRVPFNIRVAGKTQGSTVGWVGEGAPKPVSELKFNETLLGAYKVAGIVVITEELARFSRPGAEDVITSDLRDTIAQYLDLQFIDPSVTASAGVRPASITQGVTEIDATATTQAAIDVAISTAFANMATAQIRPTHWITDPTVANLLAFTRTTAGLPAWEGTSSQGGSLYGLPVIVSTAITPNDLLILISAPEIFLADEGGIEVSVSNQASVMLDSAPVEGTTPYVNLWQNNLVGIRAERFINWAKRRSAAVQVIDTVI